MAVFLGGDEKMCPIGLEAVVVSLIVYIAMVWETKVGAFYDNLRKLVATAAGYPQLVFPSASDNSHCDLIIVTHFLVQDSARCSANSVVGL